MKGLKRKVSMLLAVVLCFTTMFTNITITAVADWIPQPGNLVWVDEINLFSDTELGETEMKMYLENKEVVNNALLIRGKTIDVEVKSNAAITAGSLYLLMSGISNYIKVDLTVSEDKLTATGSFNTNDIYISQLSIILTHISLILLYVGCVFIIIGLFKLVNSFMRF